MLLQNAASTIRASMSSLLARMVSALLFLYSAAHLDHTPGAIWELTIASMTL